MDLGEDLDEEYAEEEELDEDLAEEEYVEEDEDSADQEVKLWDKVKKTKMTL